MEPGDKLLQRVHENGTRVQRGDRTVFISGFASVPWNYFNNSGKGFPVDNRPFNARNRKVGDFVVWPRNVRQVGIKNPVSPRIRSGKHSDPKYRYLGIRPQKPAGDTQVEFTVDSAMSDGADVTIRIDSWEQRGNNVCLGNVYVLVNRGHCRQAVEIPTPSEQASVTYTIEIPDAYHVVKGPEIFFYSKKDDSFIVRIAPPIIYDPETLKQYLDEDEDDLISPYFGHRIKDNGDGTFTYTKFLRKGADLSGCGPTIVIDVVTYYSESSDGYIYVSGAGTWSGARDAATGSGVVANTASYGRHCAADGTHRVIRWFGRFNTNGSGEPDIVQLGIFGYNNADSDVCAQKGTQGATLTTADFDSYTGSEYGSIAWALLVYNLITFNQQGKDDINLTGYTPICCRERPHDYLDVDPGGGDFRNGGYFEEETGNGKDPKLEITEVADVDDYIPNKSLIPNSTISSTVTSTTVSVTS